MRNVTVGEKELAKELLNLGVAEFTSGDAQKETQKILRRDRRRVKVLACLAIFCWIGSAATLYWFMISLLGTYAEMQQAGGPQVDPLVETIYGFLIGLASSIEGLIFAVLFTMLLLFFSRRATLRQINVNLVEIARLLRDHSPKE